MPKNKVSDPITDQEMAFARLVLAGGMTDRQAAEAVGLNPDSAAYTKSKPDVRAYMLEHRAAVQQQLAQQQADALQRRNLERERVLTRLWAIADLSPEVTRGSANAQVRALSMIIAIQNLIPDRRALSRPAVSSEKESAPAPAEAEIYVAEWLRNQKAQAIAPEPIPATAQEEDSSGVPEPVPVHSPAGVAPPEIPVNASQAPPPGPYGPGFSFVPDASGPFVPDTRVPFSISRPPSARRPR